MLYTVLMTIATQPLAQSNTILVPMVTLQEMPQVTDAHRDMLRAEFDQIVADMKAGDFIAYSPQWLRGEFLEAFEAAPL